jgi:hypothetical protein
VSNRVYSVLVFPYGNQLEVRVTRSTDWNEKPTAINIYHAKYQDRRRCKSLAKWASKLNELVLMKMVDHKVSVGSPLK